MLLRRLFWCFVGFNTLAMPILFAQEGMLPANKNESLLRTYKLPSGKCLNAGGIVTVEACNNNYSQNWKFSPSGQFINQNGMCLTLIGGSTTVAACQANPAFNWKTQSDGAFVHSSGKCLTAGGDIHANGTRVIVTPCANTPAQQWR